MRRFAIAASLSLIAGSNAALAADLIPPPGPPPQAPATYVPTIAPVYNWGSIYVGINGGYGFASGDATYTITGNPVVSGAYTGTGNLDGFLAGGTIGANYQMGQAVFGIEGDWDWSGQSKADTFSCSVGCTASEAYKIPWLATVRGRVGYAFDRVLVYGTAGVAFINATDTATGSAGGMSATLVSVNDTAIGWTAGAGVEFGITENLTRESRVPFRVGQTDWDRHDPGSTRRRLSIRKRYDFGQPHPRWPGFQIRRLLRGVSGKGKDEGRACITPAHSPLVDFGRR